MTESEWAALRVGWFIGVGMATILLVILDWLREKKHKHKHDYAIVAARTREQPVMAKSGEFATNVYTPLTDVLFRCDCGKFFSDDVHGKWTLTDLRGESVERVQSTKDRGTIGSAS